MQPTFKLLRSFSWAAALAMAATAALLILVHRMDQIAEHVDLAEEENVRLSRTIANTLWPRFGSFIANANTLDTKALRTRPQVDSIDAAVRNLASGVQIVKVKVYDPRGWVVYSPDRDELGPLGRDHPERLRHALEGRVASELEHQQDFVSFEGPMANRYVVETYFPLLDDIGDVAGVLELYSDVTAKIRRTEQISVNLLLFFGVVFGALYGVLFGVVGYAERTIERQHRELRESEARYGSLVNSIPAITYTADPDERGTITWVSPQVTRYLGLDDSMARLEPDFRTRHIHPADLPRVRDEMSRVSRSHRPFCLDYRLVAQGGKEVWVRDEAVVVRDADGRPICVQGVMYDLTDRTEMEERARLLQAELAHAQRVGALGEMATNLAHELNQPLSVIASYAQGCLEMRDAGPETLRPAIEKIALQAERASDIIKEIRRFLRKEPPIHTMADLNALVGGVEELIRGECRRHGLTLKLELRQGLPTVAVVAIQIQQVILNLARNGIDAMIATNGDGRLTLGTSWTGGDDVEVMVEDTGTGVVGEALARLFEPFHTTKNDGLGLGLVVSRSIVEAHGGRLWFEPGASGGARFCFTLPLTRSLP